MHGKLLADQRRSIIQISFQNSKGQKSHCKFLGVRSELLLSIFIVRELLTSSGNVSLRMKDARETVSRSKTKYNLHIVHESFI